MGQVINSILVGLFNGGATALQSVRRNAGNTAWEAYTPSSGGVTDHGDLDGLDDDDHTQYALLAGRAGGQTLVLGSLAGEGLLAVTRINPVDGKLGINTAPSGGDLLQIDSGANAFVARLASSNAVGAFLGLTCAASTGYLAYTGSSGHQGSDHFVFYIAGDYRWSLGASGMWCQGFIEMQQVASGGTPSTNSARIFAKDVAGTAEVHVRDEAGNETQISPHAMDGPADLYDLADSPPHVVKELNHFIGGVRYLNVSRACMLLEELLKAIRSGITLPNIRTALQAKPVGAVDLYRTESFAQHNTRLGTSLVKLDWDTIQNGLQADYNAARAAEVAAHDAWEALPEEDRGPEPSVRPAVDIRKAKPAWLAARGG